MLYKHIVHHTQPLLVVHYQCKPASLFDPPEQAEWSQKSSATSNQKFAFDFFFFAVNVKYNRYKTLSVLVDLLVFCSFFVYCRRKPCSPKPLISKRREDRCSGPLAPRENAATIAPILTREKNLKRPGSSHAFHHFRLLTGTIAGYFQLVAKFRKNRTNPQQ